MRVNIDDDDCLSFFLIYNCYLEETLLDFTYIAHIADNALHHRPQRCVDTDNKGHWRVDVV